MLAQNGGRSGIAGGAIASPRSWLPCGCMMNMACKMDPILPRRAARAKVKILEMQAPGKSDQDDRRRFRRRERQGSFWPSARDSWAWSDLCAACWALAMMLVVHPPLSAAADAGAAIAAAVLTEIDPNAIATASRRI